MLHNDNDITVKKNHPIIIYHRHDSDFGNGFIKRFMNGSLNLI